MKIRTLNYLIDILVNEENTEIFKRSYVGFVLNDLSELIDEIEFDRKNEKKSKAIVNSDSEKNEEQSEDQDKENQGYEEPRRTLALGNIDFSRTNHNSQNQTNIVTINYNQDLAKQISKVKNEIADMISSEVDNLYQNIDNLGIEDNKIKLYTVYSALCIIALSQGIIDNKEDKQKGVIEEEDVREVIEFIKQAQMYSKREELKERLKQRASKAYQQEIASIQQEGLNLKDIDFVMNKLNMIEKIFPSRQIGDLDKTATKLKDELDKININYNYFKLKQYYLQTLVDRYIPNGTDKKNPLNKLKRELKKYQKEIKLIEERFSAISEAVKNFDMRKEATSKLGSGMLKFREGLKKRPEGEKAKSEILPSAKESVPSRKSLIKRKVEETEVPRRAIEKNNFFKKLKIKPVIEMMFRPKFFMLYLKDGKSDAYEENQRPTLTEFANIWKSCFNSLPQNIKGISSQRKYQETLYNYLLTRIPGQLMEKGYIDVKALINGIDNLNLGRDTRKVLINLFQAENIEVIDRYFKMIIKNRNEIPINISAPIYRIEEHTEDNLLEL